MSAAQTDGGDWGGVHFLPVLLVNSPSKTISAIFKLLSFLNDAIRSRLSITVFILCQLQSRIMLRTLLGAIFIAILCVSVLYTCVLSGDIYHEWYQKCLRIY